MELFVAGEVIEAAVDALEFGDGGGVGDGGYLVKASGFAIASRISLGATEAVEAGSVGIGIGAHAGGGVIEYDEKVLPDEWLAEFDHGDGVTVHVTAPEDAGLIEVVADRAVLSGANVEARSDEVEGDSPVTDGFDSVSLGGREAGLTALAVVLRKIEQLARLQRMHANISAALRHDQDAPLGNQKLIPVHCAAIIRGGVHLLAIDGDVDGIRIADVVVLAGDHLVVQLFARLEEVLAANAVLLDPDQRAVGGEREVDRDVGLLIGETHPRAHDLGGQRF